MQAIGGAIGLAAGVTQTEPARPELSLAELIKDIQGELVTLRRVVRTSPRTPRQSPCLLFCLFACCVMRDGVSRCNRLSRTTRNTRRMVCRRRRRQNVTTATAATSHRCSSSSRWARKCMNLVSFAHPNKLKETGLTHSRARRSDAGKQLAGARWFASQTAADDSARADSGA